MGMGSRRSAGAAGTPARGKRSSVPTVEMAKVLDYYQIAYTDRHGWQKILCPFHNESQASCTVNIESGGFNCHACDKSGGDAIQFVRLKEDTDFATAVRLCAEITGVEHVELSRGPAGRPDGSSSERVPSGQGYRPKFGGGVSSRRRGSSLLD